jgi:TPR repeat protein
MEAGCNVLGGILVELGGPQNYARARTLFENECMRGRGAACDNLGQVYERSTPPDHDHAKEAFKQACDLGNSPGCTHLGEMVSKPGS